MNYDFGEAYFEYFESCTFSRENTNIDVSVFMFDLMMINMSSECEYDWYWQIPACSTEYEFCDSFASLTRQQTSYSGSACWYFWYQSIHIQITYTYLFNSTEWCYIKRTTDNVLQILLQASRLRVKTANTILQIPWKKVKSYGNTPTWSKHSANSQCKAWICKKKYHGY
jgi:hypothetical protein